VTGCAFLPVEDAGPSKWPILGVRSDRSEIAIQLAFRKAARTICPRVRIVAVPNGTYIASMAGRRRADNEGRSKGFPDVLCLWHHGDVAANVVPQVAMIEFKRGTGGHVSDEQNKWLDWLHAAGFACCVSRHEDHALEFLRGLGAPFVDNTARPIGEIVEPIIADIVDRIRR